ncbi:MAG: hypothetical protein QW241_08295, partial [Candidatus Bathyarchaeia archaeon]
GEALMVAKSIGDDSFRSSALSYVARALAEAGEPCGQVLGEALKVAKSIGDDYHRSIALSYVARALAEAGEPCGQVLDEALKVAKSIGDDYYRSSALSDVARALAEAGEIGEALMVAKSIESNYLRSIALATVASSRVLLLLEPENNAVVVPPVSFRIRLIPPGKETSRTKVRLHIGNRWETLVTDEKGYAELKWNPKPNSPIQLEWWAEAKEKGNRLKTRRRRITCAPYIPPPPETLWLEEKIEKVKKLLRKLEGGE